MKKQLIITVFIFFAAFGLVRAQTLPSLSEKNTGDIRLYFQKYYKVKGVFEMESCVKCVLYAKFKVTVNGKVEDFDISKNGPSEIKQALKTVVMATSGHWKFDENDKKGMTDKVILLPLICVYEAGCSPGLVDSAALKPKTLTDILKQAEHDNMFYNSVQQMMDFESGRYKSLNCIILAPLTTGILE